MKLKNKILFALSFSTFCVGASFAASNEELSQLAQSLNNSIHAVANQEPKISCYNNVGYAAALAHDASISFSLNNREGGKARLYATAESLKNAENNRECTMKNAITRNKNETYRIIKLI